MTESRSTTVEKRDDTFAIKPSTKIWHEEPSAENPYLAQTCRLHGYDLTELIERRSFVEVFFLLFRAELPSADEAKLLETAMIAFINPGPRHPATRAAMLAGVGKTHAEHILPIGLSVLGGSVQGAGDIEETMRFLRAASRKPAESVAQELLAQNPRPVDGEWHIAPGFGTVYCGRDPVASQTATILHEQRAADRLLKWGQEFSRCLHEHGAGWLMPGVAAAVLGDLGFQPRAGAGLFQLFAAPGLFAQGIEQANKPVTAMPFPSDEDYTIER
jgi:citrate synthase